jgi:hypothetical protein
MSLDYHYQTIGYILDHLISSGLRRVDLSDENSMDVMLYREGPEEEVHATFNDVLHWMLDEGLIRAASIQSGDPCDHFNGVQLTSKALAVIQTDPRGAGNLDKSVEKTIVESKQGELTADVYGRIGSFVGGVLGGFGQSFG